MDKSRALRRILDRCGCSIRLADEPAGSAWKAVVQPLMYKNKMYADKPLYIWAVLNFYAKEAQQAQTQTAPAAAPVPEAQSGQDPQQEQEGQEA